MRDLCSHYVVHICSATLDWTRILKQAKIPEPPGRPEVIRDIEAKPYVKHVRKTKSKSKKKR